MEKPEIRHKLKVFSETERTITFAAHYDLAYQLEDFGRLEWDEYGTGDYTLIIDGQYDFEEVKAWVKSFDTYKPALDGLKIFHDDYDWVVASDPAEATRLWEKHNGSPREHYEDEEWIECDPAETISAWLDPDDELFPVPAEYLAKNGQFMNLYTASTEQWLAIMEKIGFRGFWISTEE